MTPARALEALRERLIKAPALPTIDINPTPEQWRKIAKRTRQIIENQTP